MDKETNRRRLLSWTLLGASAVAGAAVGVPILGYLLKPPLSSAKEVWRDVGAVDAFASGQTVKVAFEDPSPLPWSGKTAATAAWLRRDEQGGFTAYAINCTHLGCPVNWKAEAQLFLCPCHGGVFDADGRVVVGPPARPLWRHDVHVRSGRVEIRTRPLPLV